MSLVYHGYRVNKDEFWDVVDEIREVYIDEHFSMEPVHQLCESIEEGDVEGSMHKLSDLIDAAVEYMRGIKEYESEINLVRLQIYDINDNEYTFRVLEPGFFFSNVVYEEIDALERLHYDGRTDITDEEREVKPLVDKVVDLQEANRYMLVPVLSSGDLFDVYLNRGLSHRHE